MRSETEFAKELNEMERADIQRIIEEMKVEDIGRIPWFEFAVGGLVIWAVAAATVYAIYLW